MARTRKWQVLSLSYRLRYRIRSAAMHVFGPAQLGVVDDPHERMRRERAAKVAALEAKAEAEKSPRT